MKYVDMLRWENAGEKNSRIFFLVFIFAFFTFIHLFIIFVLPNETTDRDLFLILLPTYIFFVFVEICAVVGF